MFAIGWLTLRQSDCIIASPVCTDAELEARCRRGAFNAARTLNDEIRRRKTGSAIEVPQTIAAEESSPSASVTVEAEEEEA